MVVPIIPAGSIIRATATFIYGGAECQHKMHLRSERGIDTMFNACSYFMNIICIELLMSRMVSGVQLYGVTCALVSNEVFTEQALFPHDPTYGQIPELGAAPIVCNVAQLRTGSAGRRGRGRILFFGFPNAYIENYRKLTDYGYGQIRSMCDQLEVRLAENQPAEFYTLGVFSRKKFQQTNDPTTSFAGLQVINTKSRLSSCSKRRS
jgi:hypothetical protein